MTAMTALKIKNPPCDCKAGFVFGGGAIPETAAICQHLPSIQPQAQMPFAHIR